MYKEVQEMYTLFDSDNIYDRTEFDSYYYYLLYQILRITYVLSVLINPH